MMAYFLVLFRSGACDISDAERALSARRFTVATGHGELTATWPRSQEFHVLIDSGESVLREAVEIGERTSEPALASCDARFDVSFADLDAALDEFNTLMELEDILREVSNGFVYLSWNGHLLSPPTA
jgi:hypothetical protein